MMDDLDKMLADYAKKGGMVTILPATKYEEITGDDSRVKYWGEGIDTKENKKIKDTLREQGLTIVEADNQRNDYGGFE
tara:strand:+ start:395 stop:628 length:234 start_codon:yes stop_codon:yes gene_type:complete